MREECGLFFRFFVGEHFPDIHMESAADIFQGLDIDRDQSVLIFGKGGLALVNQVSQFADGKLIPGPTGRLSVPGTESCWRVPRLRDLLLRGPAYAAECALHPAPLRKCG